MGAAEAKLFAREGAKVVIGDVLEEEGRRTEAEINETGGECLFIRLDVTGEAEWQQAVASTVAHFGKLDVLVNNAGLYRTGLVEETTSEEWDQVLDTNAKGVFLGTKHAIPEMRKAGGGSIVNIASVSGLEGSMEASCAYHAAKAAVRLLTKSTAIQYARDGIRANSHTPGQHRNNDERLLDAGRRIPAGNVQQDSLGPPGSAGGSGLRRPLLGFGRVLLCHRQRLGH